MGFDAHDFALSLSLNDHFLCFGSGPVHISHSLSSNLINNDLTLALSLGDEHGGVLLGLDFGHFSLGVGLQLVLFLVDFGPLDLLVQLEHLPLVGSLELRQLLVLLVLQVLDVQLLLFDLVLQFESEFCFLLKSVGEMVVDVDLLNLAVLESNAVAGELLVQVVYHCGGHVRLEIVDLLQPDGVDEASHVLLYFSSKELIESASTESVDEVLDLSLHLRQSKSEVDVDVDIGVVLGWASLDGSIVVHDVLSQHGHNSAIAAVAPMGARSHQGLSRAAVLLENSEVGGNIELQVKAAAGVVTPHHNEDALVVALG